MLALTGAILPTPRDVHMLYANGTFQKLLNELELTNASSE